VRDQVEAKLIQEVHEARGRVEQAEKRFHEAPFLVAAVAPGEELPRVLPEDILERGVIDEEYESARREHRKALERLWAHTVQQGS
jgi:hypothetical protein